MHARPELARDQGRCASVAARAVIAAALTCWAAILLLVLLAFQSSNKELVVAFGAVGVIAVWRYAWWAGHVLRARRYSAHRFPRLRAKADSVAAERPSHLCVLVTSYQTESEISWQVYRSLLKECAAYGVPTTLLASVSDPADRALIELCARKYDPEAVVDVVVMYQTGMGKRAAMADGLRALSRRMPPDDTVLILMDGDTRVTPGCLERSIPFFHADSGLGALTTDNRAYSDGGDWTREWYDLRLAQRHLLMKSMSLSERVLVLTGRFSLFRGRLALQRSFIEQLENDGVDHWRLGRIKFLSGDDKSTWFWMLSRGWKMLYVPDVVVENLERSPTGSFLSSALQLMHRWYGNMLRINGRGIALGPRRMGLFTWWCLVDQRLSMWTTLTGPATLIWVVAAGWHHAVFVYLGWITLTRAIAAIVIGGQRLKFSPHYIPLLYFQQMAGALMKVYLSFHLDRQGWTRQRVLPAASTRLAGSRRPVASRLLQTAAMATFVYVVGLASGIVDLPSMSRVHSIRQAVAQSGTPATTTTVFSWAKATRESEPQGPAARLTQEDNLWGDQSDVTVSVE